MITKKQILSSIIISVVVSLLVLCFISINYEAGTSSSTAECLIPEGCPDMSSSSMKGYPFAFKNNTNGFASPQTQIYYDKAFLNFLIYFFILFIPLAGLFSVGNYLQKKRS